MRSPCGRIFRLARQSTTSTAVGMVLHAGQPPHPAQARCAAPSARSPGSPACGGSAVSGSAKIPDRSTPGTSPSPLNKPTAAGSPKWREHLAPAGNWNRPSNPASPGHAGRAGSSPHFTGRPIQPSASAAPVGVPASAGLSCHRKKQKPPKCEACRERGHLARIRPPMGGRRAREGHTFRPSAIGPAKSRAARMPSAPQAV